MSIIDKEDKRQKKKIKQAMFVARFMPYFALAFIAFAANQLAHSAGH